MTKKERYFEAIELLIQSGSLIDRMKRSAPGHIDDKPDPIYLL